MSLELDQLFTTKDLIQASFPRDYGLSFFPLHRSKERLLRSMEKLSGMKRNSFVSMKQIHGVGVRIIDKQPRLARANTVIEADGMVTNQKGLTLVVRHADCVPIFLYDPKKKVIGLAHSGWRGTVGKIGLITLLKMVNEFGCQAKDISVGLGPAAHLCCYRKPKDSIFSQLPEWQRFIGKDRKKITVDMIGFIKEMFFDVGILKKHLKVSHVCTVCNHDYFSWVRQRDRGEEKGMNLSVIGLKMV